MKNEFVDRIEETVYKRGGFTRFAHSVGVHPSGVYRWMMGETKPDFESLANIGRLGVDLNWLIFGKQQQSKRKR